MSKIDEYNAILGSSFEQTKFISRYDAEKFMEYAISKGYECTGEEVISNNGDTRIFVVKYRKEV